VKSRFSGRLPAEQSLNRLTALHRQRQASGPPLFDLTVSNPTAAGLEPPPGQLRLLTAPEGAVYRPDPRGLEDARRAVVEDLGGRTSTAPPPDPEQVILTASTSEAYGFLFKLLCDPGDEILVPSPGYPLLEHLAALEGVRALPYPLSLQDRWRLEVSAVESALTRRTRAVVLVSPHNPTGWLLSRAELDGLGCLTTSRDLPLISDEVFGDFTFTADEDWQPPPVSRGDEPAPPVALSAGGGLRFSLGGISKGSGLPQMKVGWIVVGGDERFRSPALERLELIADTYLSVATPQQMALPGWLAAADSFRQHLRRRLRRNRRVVKSELNGRGGCQVLPAGGGWSAVLRLPDVLGDEEDALALLDRHDVLVHPGYFFDFPGGSYLVLSLLVESARFAEGIGRVGAYLDQRRGD
jgi:aspartate/methionine/tyrosine aminotransferase